jgi:raffinose/stachyose/melibiose transport system permease protein/N-acetylglucosamine transport system permease protein
MQNTKFSKQISVFPHYLILTFWAASAIFTFLWVVNTSLKSNSEILVNLWGLPQNGFQWQNYLKTWEVFHLGMYMKNSLWISGLSTLFTLIVGVPASYVIARYQFPLKQALYFIFVGGMAVPRGLLVIPIFLLLHQLSLVNTASGVILIYVVLALPFTILFLVPFFSSLPSELEDAAAVDGANEFQTMFQIMLPLAAPGLITVSILNFIDSWNELLLAYVLLFDKEKQTVSIGLYNLYSSMQFSQNWVGMFAGVVMIVIPLLLVYVIFSQRIVSGITMGAVKG